MGPTDLQPVHDLVFGPSAPEHRVESVVFAADGRLYAEVLDPTVNVWAVAVYYWPELLGSLVGVALLILVGLAIRVARRPRVPGAPHCRRCNYALTGLPAEQVCPECGADPRRRRPVIGRTRRRRLALPVVLSFCMIAGYGAMHAARIKRVNSASTLFDWTWQWLDEKQFAWLDRRHRRTVRSLVEVDVASGKVTRTVRRIRDYVSPFPLSISPDGRVAVTTGASGELVAIELGSGELMRSLSRPDGTNDPLSRFARPWRHVVGWLDDATVYVQYADAPKSATPSNRAYSWDIGSGSLTPIMDLEVPPPTQPNLLPPTRRLYLVPGSMPPKAFEVPDGFGEGLKYGSTSTLVLRDLSDAGRVVGSMTGPFWANIAPTVGPDETFYARVWSRPEIQVWSLSTASLKGSLAAPGSMGTLHEGQGGLAYHAPSRRLFAATLGPSATRSAAIHVRNLETDEWIATLSFGFNGLPNSRIAVSPDGRWVAIQVIEVKVGGMSSVILTPVPSGGPDSVTSDGSAPATSDIVASFVRPGSGASASAPARPANTYLHHVLVFDLKALDH